MDYKDLFASDETGEAVRAQVTADRAAAATVLVVDSVENWPDQFIFMTGTVLPSGFIDQSTATLMKGHLDGVNIEIDSFAPGYTDLGNTEGQIAVIKPNTLWTDELVKLAQVSHNDDGTIKNDVITTPDQFADPVDPALRMRESEFDYVASGCVLTGTGYGSNLNWSLTAGVVYINGKRYTVAAATGVVVASKDTYFDLLEPVSGQVATLVYTGGNSVANNAASPALASNSVRIAIIQSGANIASVAAINQGQENKVLPIASSIPYQVTDSLGNLICPRDPSKKILGLRQRTSTYATPGTSEVAITGLSIPILVPDNGRKVRVKIFSRSIDWGASNVAVRLYDGAVGGTKLAEGYFASGTSGMGIVCNIERTLTLSAGLHTINAAILSSSSGANFSGDPTWPSFVSIELV